MLKKGRKIVITFHNTHEAMRVEELCKENGVDGRMIPIPTDITAGCGLAWRMEPTEEEKFQALMGREGLKPQGRYERILR
ncbi:MAG: DUF3343 domain-containing protein [Lachnospiraceae bacterium]|nr:DUF3343 domain-containing protein [Lachnospiraceae bacterium]